MAYPDLQIRGGRGQGGHPDREIRGEGGGLKKIFFSALWASVLSKNRGPGSPGPSPASATGKESYN